MAVVKSPFTAPANVTGVVNATAASEIAALFVTLLTYIPDGTEGYANKSPDFDPWPQALADQMRTEVSALAAAIAAAPTS